MRSKLFFIISLLLCVSCGVRKREQVRERSELRTIEIGSRRFQFDSLATRLHGSLLVETIEMKNDSPVRYQRATLTFQKDGTQVVTSTDTLAMSGSDETKEEDIVVKVKEPPDFAQKIALYGFAILLIMIIFAIYKNQKRIQL